MGTDYRDYASKLKVKPVWKKGPDNDTGYLTPPELYQSYVPFVPNRMINHGTVGENTLPYFADKVDANWSVIQKAGSVRDGRLVCAHQLIPKDDYTIYDMVPLGYGCGHCNPGVLKGQSTLNLHAFGFEWENLQNGDGGDQFTESQYIKGALTIAYHAAIVVPHIKNINIGTHWDASMGSILALAATGNASGTLDRAKNAHRDPYAGPFDLMRLAGHLWEIRKPESGVFDLWEVALYDGR